MPQKVVVYYRARKREPEASEAALAVQRDKVQKYVAEIDAEIVGEVIEREGDDNRRPAYFKAVRQAAELSKAEGAWAGMIVATDEPIGSGKAFRAPRRQLLGELGTILQHILSGPLQPFRPVIDLPSAPPDRLFLFTPYDPRHPTTPIYLCNPTSVPIKNVRVHEADVFMGDVIASTEDGKSMSEALRECGYRELQERGLKPEEWDSIRPHRCVLLSCVYPNTIDFTPWFTIEHTVENGGSVLLEADVWAIDPDNPFHVCMPKNKGPAN